MLLVGCLLYTSTEGGAQGESVYTYNSPQIPDRVKHGDFRLVKEVSTTVYSEPDGDMPQEVNRYLVPGVKFELYNASEHAVVSPETGKLVEPGNRVCTIVTDDNGLATTLDDHAKVNGWSKPCLLYTSQQRHLRHRHRTQGRCRERRDRQGRRVPEALRAHKAGRRARRARVEKARQSQQDSARKAGYVCIEFGR